MQERRLSRQPLLHRLSIQVFRAKVRAEGGAPNFSKGRTARCTSRSAAHVLNALITCFLHPSTASPLTPLTHNNPPMYCSG